jgi:signal transduction histidine kinase
LQTDFLSTAKRASQRLERQVEDVRIVVSGGKDLGLKPKLLDLEERIKFCCHELSPFAAEHNVRIVPISDAGTPVRNIRADPDRVDQILLNLGEIAIKYSQPETDVCISASRGPGGSAAVVIENTVERRLERDLEHLFQPYYRGNPARACESYGLGLAISAYLVRAHGGDIMAAMRDHHVRVGFILPRVPMIRESAPYD